MLVAMIALGAVPARADPASVIAVAAAPSDQGWTFHVTLAHGDTGRDDHADGWRIEAPDGTILGERTLFTPMSPSNRSPGRCRA